MNLALDGQLDMLITESPEAEVPEAMSPTAVGELEVISGTQGVPKVWVSVKLSI